MDLNKIARRVASNFKKQHFKCKGHKWKVPDMLKYIEEKGILPTNLEVAPLYAKVSSSPEGYFDEPFGSPEFMARALESNYSDFPIIVWNLPDGFRIADGNHRVVKAHHDGALQMPAYVLSEQDVWAMPHEKVEKKE